MGREFLTIAGDYNPSLAQGCVPVEIPQIIAIQPPEIAGRKNKQNRPRLGRIEVFAEARRPLPPCLVCS
jgi:hypothetical protein